MWGKEWPGLPLLSAPREKRFMNASLKLLTVSCEEP